MSATVIGLNSFTKVGTRNGWSKNGGLTTIFDYEGPIDKVDELFNSLIDDEAIDSLSKNKRGGKGMLAVTYVDDDGSGTGQVTEDLNVIWELVGQDLWKSIKSFGGRSEDAGAKAFNLDADQKDLEEVRQAVETSTFFVPASATAVVYRDLLLRGADEFVRSSAILRKTINVGPRSTIQGSWKGNDRAWKIDGEAGSPDLDTAGDAAILGDLSDTDDYDESKRQWLKRPPTTRQIARRRYSLVQEWWFARRWSYTLYGGDNENGNP